MPSQNQNELLRLHWEGCRFFKWTKCCIDCCCKFCFDGVFSEVIEFPKELRGFEVTTIVNKRLTDISWDRFYIPASKAKGLHRFQGVFLSCIGIVDISLMVFVVVPRVHCFTRCMVSKASYAYGEDLVDNNASINLFFFLYENDNINIHFFKFLLIDEEITDILF